MTRSFATRLLFAVLLLGNAVSSGVCAMLCRAKVCCPEAAALSVAHSVSRPSCCDNCKAPNHRSQTIAASVAPHGKDCCAWIGKKIDPPADLAKAVIAADQLGAAILAAVADIPAAEAVLLPRGVARYDSRAPPDASSESARARAPPISSM